MKVDVNLVRSALAGVEEAAEELGMDLEDTTHALCDYVEHLELCHEVRGRHLEKEMRQLQKVLYVASDQLARFYGSTTPAVQHWLETVKVDEDDCYESFQP